MLNKRQQRGTKAYAHGLWAEAFAALLLRCKGYSILEKRWQTPAGEIDLLAAKGKTLVVVEVKKRSSAQAAGEAISPQQRARLTAAAGTVLQKYQGFESLRFDAILFAPKQWPRHIKNVF